MDAGGSVARRSGLADEPSIRPLVECIDGDEPARDGHCVPVFATLLQAIGEVGECIDNIVRSRSRWTSSHSS